MANGNKRNQSRRITPWDDAPNMTPVQKFIYRHYNENYDEKHPTLRSTHEAEMINSFLPDQCPFCQSIIFKRKGYSPSGIQRYVCMNERCKRSFTSLTGTVFDSHKVSISEWLEFALNLGNYVSLNAGSKVNKNAFTTTRYWLEKVFMVLKEYPNEIVLKGEIWFDETYWTVNADELVRRPDGSKLPGISKNKICIAVACSKSACICKVVGRGKPTKQAIYEAFKDQIVPGSKLIHDGEHAHDLLVEELGLVSEVHTTAETKGLSDKENPLNRVNRKHALLTKFLESHSGFDRDKLQDYLNLFMFLMNPPGNKLNKVEILFEKAMETRATLRFRDFYAKGI